MTAQSVKGMAISALFLLFSLATVRFLAAAEAVLHNPLQFQ
jgi:hypothetical protein